MTPSHAIFAFILLAIHIASGMTITKKLEKRGVEINWWLLRFKMFGYVKQYKKIEEEETGEVPILYRVYVTSFIVLILFIIVSLIPKI